jgi:hypothetical protein
LYPIFSLGYPQVAALVVLVAIHSPSGLPFSICKAAFVNIEYAGAHSRKMHWRKYLAHS